MRVLRLLAVCGALVGAGGAQAADLAVYRHVHRPALVEPLPDRIAAANADDVVFAPPCEDDGPTALIGCRPSIQLSPDATDFRARNAFSSIRPIQKQPYRQLFSWSH